jgi:hypothetical protein
MRFPRGFVTQTCRARVAVARKLALVPASSCLDGARLSRVVFGIALVVGPVMSSAFCAEIRIQLP